MDIAGLIQNYGYLAVAVGTFLEGETILIVAGAAARRSYLAFPTVILIGTLASSSVISFISVWVGDTVLRCWDDFHPCNHALRALRRCWNDITCR
jgi:membrane protein DedA with SNARE-associated domain